MKGISPFIATILLIAITVGIGAILSVWVSSLTTSSTGTTGAGVTNATACANTYIDVPVVTSSAITYGNPSGQTITGIQIIFSATGQTPTIVTPTTATLTANQYASYAVSRSSNTSVQIKGLCNGLSVAGTCGSGQSCWQ